MERMIFNMKNNEIYGFNKVVRAVFNRTSDGKEDLKLCRQFREITSMLCQEEVITCGQRDWLNGQMLKETGRCYTGFYVPMLREYK